MNKKKITDNSALNKRKKDCKETIEESGIDKKQESESKKLKMNRKSSYFKFSFRKNYTGPKRYTDKTFDEQKIKMEWLKNVPENSIEQAKNIIKARQLQIIKDLQLLNLHVTPFSNSKNGWEYKVKCPVPGWDSNYDHK